MVKYVYIYKYFLGNRVFFGLKEIWKRLFCIDNFVIEIFIGIYY